MLGGHGKDKGNFSGDWPLESIRSAKLFFSFY